MSAATLAQPVADPADLLGVTAADVAVRTSRARAELARRTAGEP